MKLEISNSGTILYFFDKKPEIKLAKFKYLELYLSVNSIKIYER